MSLSISVLMHQMKDGRQLARLEFAKGTTLRYNNIHISEGALPECAQIRATEYEKERTRAIVLRERPDSLKQPAQMVVAKEKDLLSPDALPPIKVLDNSEGAPASPTRKSCLPVSNSAGVSRLQSSSTAASSSAGPKPSMPVIMTRSANSS